MSTTKDIREAVEAELKFDPLVDDADIHVVNVNGDVALNGTVRSYPQYLEAAAAAHRVGGVKNVHNHLEVVLPTEDFRDDAMLTTAANNALTLNVTVPDGVEATALDGNVTLSVDGDRNSTSSSYDGDQMTVLFDDHGYRDLSVPITVERKLLRGL